MTEERPTLTQLMVDGSIVGVAVEHSRYKTGEIREVMESEHPSCFVEFGKVGEEAWVYRDDISIDWEYYQGHPDHAVEVLKPFV